MNPALTSREKVLLRLALSYAESNCHDICDAFATFTEKDPCNEQGRVQIGRKKYPNPEEQEFHNLIQKLKVNGELV